jgi:hypothetical protein
VFFQFIYNTILSSIISIFGFCCFWSIFELFQQKKRVKKGWFPQKIKADNKGAGGNLTRYPSALLDTQASLKIQKPLDKIIILSL